MMNYLDKKREHRQLWWIQDERFLLLDNYQKEQLINPSRTIQLPDIDVTSHILNNAIQIAVGMTVLTRKGLEKGEEVNPNVINDIEDNIKIVADFIKAYGIAK